MKKKQNLLLLILAVLFVSLFGGSTAVSAASSFPRLQAVSSGEIVVFLVFHTKIPLLRVVSLKRGTLMHYSPS